MRNTHVQNGYFGFWLAHHFEGLLGPLINQGKTRPAEPWKFEGLKSLRHQSRVKETIDVLDKGIHRFAVIPR